MVSIGCGSFGLQVFNIGLPLSHFLRALVRAAFFAEADRFAKDRRADALPPNVPPFK